MNSGVYEIINTSNGHRYIGSALNLKKRRGVHWRRLRLGDHYNSHLQRAWNKYGEDVFEFKVIGTCPPDALLRMEQHLLDDLKPEYNLSPTAGSKLGLKHTSETRSKISAALKGKSLTDEHRANLSRARKASSRCAENTARLIAAHKGIPLSANHRSKISAALKGISRSAATRARLSVALKGNTNRKGTRGPEIAEILDIQEEKR